MYLLIHTIDQKDVLVISVYWVTKSTPYQLERIIEIYINRIRNDTVRNFTFI